MKLFSTKIDSKLFARKLTYLYLISYYELSYSTKIICVVDRFQNRSQFVTEEAASMYFNLFSKYLALLLFTAVPPNPKFKISAPALHATFSLNSHPILASSNESAFHALFCCKYSMARLHD